MPGPRLLKPENSPLVPKRRSRKPVPSGRRLQSGRIHRWRGQWPRWCSRRLSGPSRNSWRPASRLIIPGIIACRRAAGQLLEARVYVGLRSFDRMTGRPAKFHHCCGCDGTRQRPSAGPRHPGRCWHGPECPSPCRKDRRASQDRGRCWNLAEVAAGAAGSEGEDWDVPSELASSAASDVAGV